MCHHLTPEASDGEGEDYSSIHVAIGSTNTEQQIDPHLVSIRSAAASSVATPEPTPIKPTRHVTRSFAARERAREQDEHHQSRSPQQPRLTRLHFDDSLVPDMVTDPSATSPVHGTKRMRSFEEMMSETHTPEKDKMAKDIDEQLEETTKRADRERIAGNDRRADRAAKRAKLPIRNSPRLSDPNAKAAPRSSRGGDNSTVPPQEGGSQESQISQLVLEKS